jgi:accessory gene regulator protein AgrB
MSTQPTTGNRKFSATREAQLMVCLMFVVAAWLKADFQLFAVGVLGVTGNLGLFSWANAKVHATTGEAVKPTATA